MPLFPSRAWIDAVVATVATRDDAVALAQDLAGTYRFTVEPDGPITDEVVFDLVVSPHDPRLAWVEDVEQPTELTIRAPYSVWRRLLENELGVVEALVSGKARVRGSLRLAIGRARRILPLMQVLQEIDTQWPEDARP